MLIVFFFLFLFLFRWICALYKCNFIDFILLYTDVCIALNTRCFPSVCGKNFTGNITSVVYHPTQELSNLYVILLLLLNGLKMRPVLTTPGQSRQKYLSPSAIRSGDGGDKNPSNTKKKH